MPYQEDPVALKINRKSREVALHHYVKRDATHLKHWERRDDVKYSAYMDYRVDYASFYRFQSFGFDAGTANEEDFGALFFSRLEMGRIERLWLAHENISDLARDICRWIDRWLDLFPRVKEIVVEVRNLKFCGGLALGGGVFLTVAEALQNAQFRGREALERIKEEKERDRIPWEIPVLEVDDVEKLLGRGFK